MNMKYFAWAVPPAAAAGAAALAGEADLVDASRGARAGRAACRAASSGSATRGCPRWRDLAATTWTLTPRLLGGDQRPGDGPVLERPGRDADGAVAVCRQARRESCGPPQVLLIVASTRLRIAIWSALDAVGEGEVAGRRHHVVRGRLAGHPGRRACGRPRRAPLRGAAAGDAADEAAVIDSIEASSATTRTTMDERRMGMGFPRRLLSRDTRAWGALQRNTRVSQ